jgi:hypothetical protein
VDSSLRVLNVDVMQGNCEAFGSPRELREPVSPFIIVIIIIVVVLFIVIFDRWLLKNHCFGTSINQTIHLIYWSLAGPKFAPQSNCKGICRVIVSRHRQNKTKHTHNNGQKNNPNRPK